MDPKNLTWSRPADRWSEALPLGNGHLGAMVYGGVGKEFVDLSELTFFSGRPASDDNRVPTAPTAFRMARQAAVAGDWDLCQTHLESFIGRRNNYGTNLPVGRLVLSLAPDLQAGFPEDYRRELDLDQAVARTSFTLGGLTHRREVLASHPDRVLALRWAISRPGRLDLDLEVEGARPGLSPRIEDRDLVWDQQAVETLHSDGTCGVRLAGRLRVFAPGGRVEASGGRIGVRGADAVVALLALETDFGAGGLPADRALLRVDRATSLGWVTLTDRHVRDFNRLSGRVSLRLGPDSPSRDLRVDCGPLGSPVLAAVLFHYGRYLLASSSRETSPLPAHLQGVWNDGVACRIGWTCDMHLDINTQMNQWIAETGNLPESNEALFRWMEQTLVPAGRRCARESYGLGGWAAELVTNAWGYAAPYWHTNLSPCPSGGAWLADHLWERYRFSGDREFLRHRAYPLLRDAVEFFAGYLFETEAGGPLFSGPSVSPENLFLAPGTRGPRAASLSPAYERAVIRRLYRSFLEASAALGVDTPLVRRTANQLARLPGPRIAPDGSLAEWDHDHPPADPQHRHTSHLLGLFPFDEIQPGLTPELAAAARRSLLGRTEPASGWEDTGWARALLLLYSARLADGPGFLKHWEVLGQTLLTPNLMVKHPPTRGAPAFDDVYELDGNTGAAMAVAEALVQSHGPVVDLLPGLPPSWDTGAAAGLRARGGLTLGLRWEPGRTLEVFVTADQAGTRMFRYRGITITADLLAGQPQTLFFPEDTHDT